MKDIKELIHWTELVVRGMFYSVHAKTTDRNKSDDILAEKAAEITKNDSEQNRTNAELVNAIMADKNYAGLGVSKTQRPTHI